MLRVGVCGGVSVEVDGRRLPDTLLAGRQGRLVLAYLVAERHRSVPREELAELLWPDQLPSSWQSSLSVVVSKLRRLLSEAGLDPAATLASAFGSYRIHVPDDTWVDWDAAAEAVERAERALQDGQPDAALSAAKEGADIACRGFLTDDCPWVDDQRERLRDLHVRAIHALAQAHLSTSRHGRAVIAARDAVDLDESREASYRLLMQALAAAGERAQALRVWERCRVMLGEELGVDPAPETEALYLSILGETPAAGPTPFPNDAVSQPPSGTVTFLLTDIEGSTRLWQQDEAAMGAAVARHDGLLRTVVTDHDGTVFSSTGDGLAAAFGSAASAVRAATAAQARLAQEVWSTPSPLRVRMGLHTGEAELRDGDYFGTTVNRAARLMAVGHGGQVLCSGATASLIEADAALSDLGEHRLRDLDQPMRVFQIGPDRFPPLRSLDAFPGNLPAQVTSFVGRGDDLVAVAKALGASRLVTLTGTGGVGKTRLALQSAADAVTAFPDGVWFCELAVAADPDSMSQVVALALGLTPRQGVVLAHAIAEFVSARHLLLVLDNCEHLLDSAAELVTTLLERCPHVRVLATSREALGVAGEQVIRLRSLTVPERDASPDELPRVDATRLFLDRAEAAGAQVDFGPADGQAIIEICRRIDGIPLAIELAAARVIALSPTEIAAHLNERFRLLTGGRRAALERHHTLRAAVDWSYSLLTDTERQLFDCLGVFPATFGVAAAQAVAGEQRLGAWDVVDALSSLVAKSMLMADRSAEGLTRYQMLETLRHYARERLDAVGQADASRRAHARYYAATATEMLTGLRGPDEASWLPKVATELDNFRAAVAWGLDAIEDDDAELAMGIIATLMASAVAGSTGMYSWAEQAAERASEGDPRYRGLVLAAAAYDAYMRGEFVVGRQLAAEAAKDGAKGSLRAGIVLSSGLVFASADEIEALVERNVSYLDEAKADVVEYLAVHAAAAAMAVELGRVTFAQQEASTAVELGRRRGSVLHMSVALYGFGLAWWQTSPEAALTALEESLSISRHIPGTLAGARARVFALIAQLRAGAGELPGALEALREAIAITHADGDRPSMATTLARGARVMTAAGDLEAAAVFSGVISRGVLTKLHALPYPEVPVHKELVDRLRTELGSNLFESAVSRGASMPYDKVVAFALDAIAQATNIEGASGRADA